MFFKKLLKNGPTKHPLFLRMARGQKFFGKMTIQNSDFFCV